ncbi:MAG: Fe-S-containing hydro-lyase [Desulfovibrio sp.]|jgi:fumarate hydratase subunit beta|nr:Fe-S-containing hydro-lyase [Desulfovibrio sp.]
MEFLNICLPIQDEKIRSLRAGDAVLLSGVIYTGRDAAHQRLYECAQNKMPFPVNLKDQIIYYVGPAPAKPGYAVGSAGPTSSYRMDKYTPMLLDMGLKGIIGKGVRNDAVKEAIVRNKAVYFAAVGGSGALISKSIKKSIVICYDDLGTEAIHEFTIKDFPAFVAIDCKGNDLYAMAKQVYRKI